MGALKLLLIVLALGYAALAALVWLSQERLMFYPRAAPGPAIAPAGWGLEEVAVRAADGTVLAGVLLKPAAARPPLVIHYGGNAEEATSFAAAAPACYGERAVLLMNYRGYGASGGRPGEQALVADAIALYDWAAARPDIDAARIALHGRSLGSGVAVQVAAARPARCVVLTSPFTSAREVAAAIYPWLPVGLLLRHPFDSAALAPRVRAPALVLAGADDTLVPARFSARLAGLWGGPVEQVTFPGFGHNDLGIHPRYAATIHAFLERCL